jgi:hypothetical protein
MGSSASQPVGDSDGDGGTTGGVGGEALSEDVKYPTEPT